MGQPPEAKKPVIGKRVKREALSMMIRPATDDGREGRETAGEETEAALRNGQVEELAAAVGKEIRSLRLSLGMTATTLAQAAGLSNGMLSKIEGGTATPSFATLLALAGALKVPVARLFASHDQRADYSLVRAGKGINVKRRGTKAGIDYQLLGHLLSGEKYIEPYLITITETAMDSPGFQHTGVECMYVLEGSMLYRYADAVVELNAGDTLVFDANSVHGHEKVLRGPVRLLSVVFNLRT